MNDIRDKIYSFIKNKNNNAVVINEIINSLNIDEKKALSILNELEIEGIVYKNSDKNYTLMPENYYVGQLQSTKKDNLYIELEDSNRIYIDFDNLNEALNFDTVIVEEIEKSNTVSKGKVKRILKRKNSKVVCEVINTNKIKNLAVFNIKYKYKLTLSKENIKKLVIGDRILVDLPVNEQPTFIKKLGHKDDPDNDMIAIASSRDIEVEFSKESLKEAENLPTEVTEKDLSNITDFRKENIFTIDCESTKDIDDAISIKMLPNGNYELGVHIANVSHYIKNDMALYKEAQSRGNSVYLLDYVIPMFPHIISNGICSLSPNVDRLTKSCIMEIDKKGNVVNYRIVNSVINSKKKMSYNDVNKILEDNEIPNGYENFINDLTILNKLSDILTKKRRINGSLDFVSSEIKVNINSDGKATNFNLQNFGGAEKIIENCMVVANETVANHIFWLNLPFIYRIHECPDEDAIREVIKLIKEIGFKIKINGDFSNPKVIQNILNQLSDEEEYPILSNIILKGMKRARYDIVNLGHFGLSSEVYTHFTSPIRRFSDLLVHSLLDKYQNLNTNENITNYLNKLEKYLDECCKHISYKERQADLAEEDANKFKMLEYMEEHIGEVFQATIYMIDARSMTIKTDSNITGKIRFEDIVDDYYYFDNEKKRAISKTNTTIYKIGNKINVKALSTSKIDKEIYFDIANSYSLEDRPKQFIKTKEKE